MSRVLLNSSMNMNIALLWPSDYKRQALDWLEVPKCNLVVMEVIIVNSMKLLYRYLCKKVKTFIGINKEEAIPSKKLQLFWEKISVILAFDGRWYHRNFFGINIIPLYPFMKTIKATPGGERKLLTETSFYLLSK